MKFHTNPDSKWLVELLHSCALPTDDICELDPRWLIGGGEQDNPWGAVGLEVIGEVALLRSLVVDTRFRSSGRGRALVQEAQRRAQEAGVVQVYLLTKTASDFFSALGYAVIQRADVPGSIASTRQFSSLCPDSATVMHKRLQ